MRAAAITLAGAWALPALAPLHPPLRTPLRVQTRIGRGVALTFDDGPHPQGTPAMLEILAARGVTATFFVVGEQVERNPAVLARDQGGGARDRRARLPPSQPAQAHAAG